MGDTEQFDDPKSGSPDPPASAASSQDRPVVRRSSLRPAPPSFRPIARDPSQLRPVMVVHAGDVDPSAPRWEIAEPPPSHPSQVALDSAARAEPFALAEDLGSDGAQAVIPPLVIPPPGAVPRDALEPPHGPALQQARSTAAADPSFAIIGSATSKRLTHRGIALVLGAVVLVGVGAATMLGSDKTSATKTAHTATRVEQAPAQAPVATADEPSAPNDSPSAAKQPAVQPESSGQASAAASAAAPPNTTRIILDVKPIDARVAYRGAAHPGPPFEFDVPKGKRIAVEVARSGYATRKVIIDDKRPVINIGLLNLGGPRTQR